MRRVRGSISFSFFRVGVLSLCFFCGLLCSTTSLSQTSHACSLFSPTDALETQILVLVILVLSLFSVSVESINLSHCCDLDGAHVSRQAVQRRFARTRAGCTALLGFGASKVATKS